MSQSKVSNFVYFASEKNESPNDKAISYNQLTQILKTIANQILKEKTPSLKELENVLEESIGKSPSDDQSSNESIGDKEPNGNDEPLIKLLYKMGYLKDDKKWLTKKAFFEIGQKILRDVIKDIDDGNSGFHETTKVGYGDSVLDTSARIDLGDEVKHLNTPQTLLNAVQRKQNHGESLQFPLEIKFDDLEKFETKDEVKTAIVYCIDLSSTMKYALSSGEGTRIEAAKKALWALYVLNNKFFPNDSIYVVGFGSLASKIVPHDIPYLKTYDANDNFLHYTNYQAALRLSLKILKRDGSQNKRIILITDGQPSACYIDNELQKNEILSEKPYSHFYKPDESTLVKMKNERDIRLDISNELVYLCYRYKQVDPSVDSKTLNEAKKCKNEGIEIDTIVISDETELISYVENFEKKLHGRAYYINPETIGKVLISDFISNKKRTL